MEIDQQLHAAVSRAPADLLCLFQIVVAAAVAVAVRVIGIVPDAHADVIDAVVSKYFENILRLPCLIFEAHTGVFERDDRGDIHTADKIRVLKRDLFHGDTVAHRRVCRRRDRHDGACREQCRQYESRLYF